jgi:hypothetical protein
MSEGMVADPIPSMLNAGDYFAGVSARASGAGNLDLWGGDEFSFADLLDLVNPLQHIPILSNWYRSATGDEIGAVARIFGGALLGGPIGAVTAVINSTLESETGKDLSEHALALLSGDESFGDGEAPLLASMGDRSADFWLGESEQAPPGRGEEVVQNADAGGTVEVDDLPWLGRGSADDGQLLATSTGPGAAVREIGADDPLPWLDGSIGPTSAATAAVLAARPSPASPSDDGTSSGERQVPHGPWVADAMMNALDKYGALVRRQGKQVVDSAV